MYLLLKNKQNQKWTTSDYYGETDWLMQQHQFVEFENPKVTGDLAITYLKVPSKLAVKICTYFWRLTKPRMEY